MIPYIYVPDVKVGPLTLHPFGLLVATGVILGTWLATRRAKARGLDLDKLNSFITWMLIVGFLGGHMLDQVFYHWPEFVARPWSIFLLYEGLSSFGGFVGALIGIVLWKYFEAIPIGKIPFFGFTIPKYRKRERPMPILPFADIILSVFPVAWVFGRSGCSVVHDHPGALATPQTLLAVAFPDEGTIQRLHHDNAFALVHGIRPQFDLGLLEMMFTVILASMLALTWHKKLTTGSYVVMTALCYAPVRFAMDYLRVKDVAQADPRFGGLTPAQWACVALFTFGLVMIKVTRDIKKSGKDPQDMLIAPGSVVPDAAEEPAGQNA